MWLQTLIVVSSASWIAAQTPGAAYDSKHKLSLGYLGASNDTATSNEILRLLSEELNDMAAIGDIPVVSRMTNKCDVGEAIRDLFELLDGLRGDILALVVYGCTEVLKVIGEFAPNVNLTVLGLGSSSAVLKNRVKYPTMQLLVEVENTHSEMRVSFVENMGWTRVATVAEDYEDFTLAAENFLEVALDMNCSVSVNQSLTLVDSYTDIASKIATLSEDDLRIIFMFGTQKVLEKILRLMSSTTDFLNTRRVIITNQDISKVPAEIKELFYIGYASTQGVRSSSRDEHSSIIYSLIDQLTSFLSQLPPSLNSAQQIKSAFNSKFIYQGNFTTSLYRHNPHLNPNTKHLYDLLATSNDRDRWVKVTRKSLWPDGGTPLDRKEIVHEDNEISSGVLCTFIVLSILASIVAVVFLVISCKYRHVGPVKMTSPKLNYFNIAGAICLYGYVSVMGLSHPRLSLKAYEWTCTLRNLLLCGGYSFVFGPMCAKAYRVYYIFSSSRHGKISRKRLKDGNLLLFTGCLVLFDIVFIISWHLIDPFEVQITTVIAPDRSGVDKEVHLRSYTCSSMYLPKWLGVVYAYKGMLLIWGVYLAWTTRNVFIPTLNDSKSIIVNIYVVLIASVIVVIVSEFLQHHATLSYSIVGCLILLSTTIMLGVLFIPMMVALRKISEDEQRNAHLDVSAGQGMGLVTTSCNTKRLESDCTEDIRELELQTTILQSELRKLDEEIDRLENMAQSPSIRVSDILAEDLLYIIPLPNNSEDPLSCKLTRRNTPKYRMKRTKQQEWLSRQMQRESPTSPNILLQPPSASASYVVDVSESIEEESEQISDSSDGC